MAQMTLTSFEKIYEKCVLCFSFKGHQVHAVLPAEVSPFQPITFQILKPWFIFGEKVVVTTSFEVFRSCNDIFLKFSAKCHQAVKNVGLREDHKNFSHLLSTFQELAGRAVLDLFASCCFSFERSPLLLATQQLSIGSSSPQKSRNCSEYYAPSQPQLGLGLLRWSPVIQ